MHSLSIFWAKRVDGVSRLARVFSSDFLFIALLHNLMMANNSVNSENDANMANAWKGTDDMDLRIDMTTASKDVERNIPAKKINAKKNKEKMPSQKHQPSSSSPSAASNNSQQQQGDDMDDDEIDYVPRWARSSKAEKTSSSNNGGDYDDNTTTTSLDQEHTSQYSTTDTELPPFADEASIALHREIKLLEQRRDEAVSTTRSNKERVDIINDHLRSIRQEIDHTDSLVAAKKSEVDTEEHLLSLSQRELGQNLRDASALESGNATVQNNIKSAQSQIKVAEDEVEKLRTDLNWNQEELEQWATAATKKEEESLALQKYTLSDELKIKELALTIEDLTKLSVEKKTLLENEVTETKSNQTELEKLAERFKNRHDERGNLLQQWKDTIASMNNRDQTINELAGQYSGYAEKEDTTKQSLLMNREQFQILEVSCIYH